MNSKNQNQLIIVISSPSGAGKTSVCKKLLSNDNSLKLSISDTTRLPRDNEVEAKDYYFISKEEFQDRISKNQYIEYAKVFGNYYGSRLEIIENYMNEGKDVLFDIDWQGASQLKKSVYKNIVSIFLLPPSKSVILKRLKSRALESGDDEKAISKRMEMFEIEISHKSEYEHIVINDNLDQCVMKIDQIICNARESKLGN